MSLLLFAFLLFVVALLAFLCWAIWMPYQRHAYYRAQGITGPSFIPIVGVTPDYRGMVQRDRQLDWWLENSRRWNHIKGQKQGVWSCFLGPLDRLIVSDPDMLQSILKSNSDCYDKGPAMRNVMGQLLGCENLLLSEGEHHKASRKIIAPAFHYQNLNSMVYLMVQQTEKTLIQWNQTIQQHQQIGNNVHMEVHQQMSDLTLNIVAACVFGSAFLHSNDVHHVIYHTFNDILAQLTARALNLTGLLPIIRDLPLPSKRRIDVGAAKLRAVVDVILNDRQKGNSQSACQGADLLDLLLSATDEETGQGIPIEQIKQEALTFILAGHETTSNLLTWALRLLAEHPDIYARCRSEVDNLFPDGDTPTASSLSSMHYIDAVLHEVARLYPPAPWIMRRCVKENVIGVDDNRITVPAGANVLLMIVATQHDSIHYPNPETFDPERWLRKDPSEKRHPFAYLPFSAGQRGCIGNNFALMESKVILSMIVQRFDLFPLADQKIVPVIQITMRPKYGLRVHIRPRGQAPAPGPIPLPRNEPRD